jgi:Uma2 family endonuclease
MVELKMGWPLRTVDVPFMIRLYGVTDEQFDEMVTEDTKAELFDGVMIVHSPATPDHDDIAGFQRALMRIYADDRGLGKVFGPDSLVRLRRGRRFGADIFFIRSGRVPSRPAKEFELVPDLMLEVLSPSNRDYDLDEKRAFYREARVPEIWFIDPDERQVIVDRRRGRRYITTTATKGRVQSDVLPGFWIEASWLWSDPLPNAMACLRRILAEPEA